MKRADEKMQRHKEKAESTKRWEEEGLQGEEVEDSGAAGKIDR